MKRNKIALVVAAAAVSYSVSSIAQEVDFNIGGQLIVDNSLTAEYTLSNNAVDFENPNGEFKEKRNSSTGHFATQADDSYLTFNLAASLDDMRATSWVRFYSYGRVRYNFQVEDQIDDYTVSAKFEQNIDNGVGSRGNQTTGVQNGNAAPGRARDQWVKIAHSTGVYLLGGRKTFFDGFVKGADVTDYLSSTSELMYHTGETRFNALNLGFENDILDTGIVYTAGNPTSNGFQNFTNDDVFDQAYIFYAEEGIGFGQGVGFAISNYSILTPTEIVRPIIGLDENDNVRYDENTSVNGELFGLYAHVNVANVDVSLEYIDKKRRTDTGQTADGESLGTIEDNYKAGYYNESTIALGAAYTVAISDTINVVPFLNFLYNIGGEGKVVSTVELGSGPPNHVPPAENQAEIESSGLGYNVGVQTALGDNVIILSYADRSVDQELKTNDQDIFEANGDLAYSKDSTVDFESSITAYEITYHRAFGDTGAWTDVVYAYAEGKKTETIISSNPDNKEAEETYSVLGIRFGYAF